MPAIGTVISIANAILQSINVKYANTLIERVILDIHSGITCAKGSSIVSTLSTITLLSFPTDSPIT